MRPLEENLTMKNSFWREWWKSICQAEPAHRISRKGIRRGRLLLEALEDRTLLSGMPHMLLDVNPGAASSSPFSTGVAIGSTTYFTADDGVHGRELWRTDGTAAGTAMVKDINPGSAASNVGNLGNLNGTLFFTADDGTHGSELWKSDGTAAGTTLVKDINPGGGTDYYGRYVPHGSSIGYLTIVNGTMLFSADDGTSGQELWKSDGTAAGTTLVKDIFPGSGTIRQGDPYSGYSYTYVVNSSSPSNLRNVNGTLFFTAWDGTYFAKLWKSDGTTAGTVVVKDINPGVVAYQPSDLTNVNGTLFFKANNRSSPPQLWKSDGTEAGTVMVKEMNFSAPTNVNGTLFFSGDDATHARELWKSDGTTAGTVMVKDINPGVAASEPSDLTNVNGRLFFSAWDATHGKELWQSDGTTAGTVLVADINPGIAASDPHYITNVNGTLFFSAWDATHGYELWQSDGTAAGTVLIDINPGSASSGPHSLTNVNGTLFFSAYDAIHGDELWILPPAGSTPASVSFTVSGFPSSTTAGAAGNFTVTAKNADGTTATGYTGTVHFTSSDGQAVLPTDYTFTAADQGVHTFTATLKTAGTQSITATDTMTSSFAGAESGITVKPAAASALVVAGFPSPTTAGSAHGLTVTAKDAYGNTAVGYTGAVHFTSSDPKAVLPANYTFTAADAGAHTFSATLKTAGTQSIAATDTITPSIAGTDGGIAVSAAAASRFVITGPSSVTAGSAFGLTITVQDAYGNVVTGYTGTVHFKSTDGTATLPANYTFSAADQGGHTFAGLVLRKRGSQKITLTDTLNNSLTGGVIENVL
jgi:ELWxxDGT repeat protein